MDFGSWFLRHVGGRGREIGDVCESSVERDMGQVPGGCLAGQEGSWGFLRKEMDDSFGDWG